MIKKTILILALLFLFHDSTFAFTIINQTSSKKLVKIHEAYRLEPKVKGDLEEPIPFNKRAKKVVIGPKSRASILLEPACPVLLITLSKFKTKKRNDHKIFVTRCFQSNLLNEENENMLISDDWGLVIHEPIDYPTIMKKYWYLRYESIGILNMFEFDSLKDQEMEEGYGLKFLQPRELDLITSVDHLPDELQPIYSEIFRRNTPLSLRRY